MTTEISANIAVLNNNYIPNLDTDNIEAGALKKSNVVQADPLLLSKGAESANTKPLTAAAIRQPKKTVDSVQLAQTTAQISQCFTLPVSNMLIANDKTRVQDKTEMQAPAATASLSPASARESAVAQATLGAVSENSSVEQNRLASDAPATGRKGFDIQALNSGFTSRFNELSNTVRETMIKLGDVEAQQQTATIKLARQNAESSAQKAQDAAQQRLNGAAASFAVSGGLSITSAGLGIKAVHKTLQSSSLNKKPALMDQSKSERLKLAAQGDKTLMENPQDSGTRAKTSMMNHDNNVTKSQYFTHLSQAGHGISSSAGNIATHGFGIAESEDMAASKLHDNSANTMNELAEAKRKNRDAVRELIQEINKVESESKSRVDAASYRV